MSRDKRETKERGRTGFHIPRPHAKSNPNCRRTELIEAQRSRLVLVSLVERSPNPCLCIGPSLSCTPKARSSVSLLCFPHGE